jgi:predicted DNA-binding protein (UPF0251 family)
MAKQRKSTRKGSGKGRGRKPTHPDNGAKTPAGPIGVVENVIDARAELDRRRKQAIAKAALELDHVDGEILRLMLMHPGITQEQIGDLVGLTRQTVNERVNSPKFDRALEVSARSALEIFESNKSRAARVLGELLGSKDDRVRIRAAIAHMWPHIHGDLKDGSASDFVNFIQEAYELAKGEPAADAPPATAGKRKP